MGTPPVRATAPLPGTELSIPIEDSTSDGRGVGRHAGWVVFVPGALPGDRVRARAGRRRRGVVEADLVAIESPSPWRVDPPCPHQEQCGGCPLMPLSLERQRAVKERHLEETMRRIGRIPATVSTWLPSPHGMRYRGRVRFAVAPRRRGGPALGFRPRGAPGEIVEVQECHVAPEAATRIARRFLDRLDAESSEGRPWPTHLEARGSFASGEWLLVVYGGPGPWPELAAAARELARQESTLAGVVRVEAGPGEAGRESLLLGCDTLVEELDGIGVELGATTFLQVNPSAAVALYREVRRQLAASGPPRRLLDLFCGAGLIGLLGVDDRTEVLGIEQHAGSVARASRAAAAAGRERLQFHAGDARGAVRRLARIGERFDAVTANPPRAGLGADLAPAIAALAPRAVLLVSCHPATLARDARGLADAGFELQELAAVDMFPQTPHLEAVARFVPRGEAR